MTVYVQLHNHAELLAFFNCQKYTYDGVIDHRLEISDREGDLVASFSLGHISSWWVEDNEPETH